MGGKVVLVTGGTGNLGSSVTQLFLEEGNRVVTTYIEGDEWDSLREWIDSDDLRGFKVDVTSSEQVDGLVQKVVDEIGNIDYLFNLVGGYKGGKMMHEVDVPVWEEMMRINLRSAFLVSRKVLPLMRDRNFGSIINIGSKLGNELKEKGGPYAIAKKGIESLTRIMARENDDMDITVNCINPSVIGEEGVEAGEIAEVMSDVVKDRERNGEVIPLYG